MQAPLSEDLNLNQLIPPHVQQCGYCNQKKAKSIGFIKSKMQPTFYKDLMERGWRRCGNYYYKNYFIQNCCKMWVIRNLVHKFIMSKDQRKTWKNNGQIFFGLKPIPQLSQNHPMMIESNEKQYLQSNKRIQSPIKLQKDKIYIGNHAPPKMVQIPPLYIATFQEMKSLTTKFAIQCLPKLIAPIYPLQNINFDQKSKLFMPDSSQKCHFYSNLLMLIFGCNKLSFKQMKLQSFVQILSKHYEDYLTTPQCKVKVEHGGYVTVTFTGPQAPPLQFKDGKIQMSKQQKKQKLNLDSKKIIINDKPQICQSLSKAVQLQCINQQNQKQIQKNHDQKDKFSLQFEGNMIQFGQLQVKIVPAAYRQQDFQLYTKYCQSIHQKQQKSIQSYKNFLCLRALGESRSQISNGTRKCQFLQGCYHFQYYFRGRLIGVSVCDLVPTGLSSVYFFYDPSYKRFRLGVFSAILQIEYVKQNFAFFLPQDMFLYLYQSFHTIIWAIILLILKR